MKYSKANKHIFQASALAAGITFALATPVMAAQFEGFEPGAALTEPDGITANDLSGGAVISGDGSVLAMTKGNIFILHGNNWSQFELPAVEGNAYAMTQNGSIITGEFGVLTGENWSRQITLTGNGTSGTGRAITSDGKTIAGSAAYDGTFQATIWTGDNWANETNLGTVTNSGEGKSWAYAISDNGTVVVGSSYNDVDVYKQAAVWSKKNNAWIGVTIGTLTSDDKGESQANAISADGTIVVGNAATIANDLNTKHAAVWTGSGSTWNKAIDLGTLRSDDSGSSVAQAISADGTVVVGASRFDDSEYNSHAVLWLNTEGRWGKGIDLTPDSVGHSSANSISNDKSVVAGTFGTNYSSGAQHAMLWKLNWKQETPEVVKGVDATNTVTTIGQLAGDTFAAMELQRQGLIRLQDGCTTAAQGEACGQVRAGIVSQGDQRDTATGFSIAYGAADNLSLGVSLDRSLSRSLPSSYQKKNNNIGGGLYAQWNNPFDAQDWFIRGAASFNQYSVDVIRPTLSNTEAGTGSSKMKGTAFTLETGQNVHHQDGRIAGWNAGVRHSNVTRDGYTEGNAEFPVTYGSVDYGMTSAFLGGIYVHPLTAEVKLVTRAQIEQDLATNDAEYKASASYIGGFVQKADMTKTRGLLAAGPSWDITKDMQASMMPYVGNSALGDTTWGADLRLTARF